MAPPRKEEEGWGEEWKEDAPGLGGFSDPAFPSNEEFGGEVWGDGGQQTDQAEGLGGKFYYKGQPDTDYFFIDFRTSLLQLEVKPARPDDMRTGSTMSWFSVSSNISIVAVRGARNSAPRVAAAPTDA